MTVIVSGSHYDLCEYGLPKDNSQWHPFCHKWLIVTVLIRIVWYQGLPYQLTVLSKVR